VIEARNRALLKACGCVVYLHARPTELAKRLGRDRSRPLLQGADPRTRLDELYTVRDPLYREVADVVMETGRQSANSLVGQLLMRLERECTHST
jgi:shikimate kinase